MHFYSPGAYNYVRSVLNDSLPCISTIRKWYSSINGDPGFSKEAFDALKLKAIDARTSGKELLANLTLDEVYIRMHQQYDHHKDEMIGQVDYGKNLVHNNIEKPKLMNQALVYMITGVNVKFKIPVGYFLADGLSADEKAAFTQEVVMLSSKTGIKIVGMTFDGATSNIAMCKILEADFKAEQTFITNPHSDDKIFCFLDPSHMLKLIRNCLVRLGVIYDGEGGAIKWAHIDRLHEYQRLVENTLNGRRKKCACELQLKRSAIVLPIRCCY